jgi:hypothetical protein
MPRGWLLPFRLAVGRRRHETACSNDVRQNELVRILSSRTLVTRRGARPVCNSTKPQFSTMSSRSPLAAVRAAIAKTTHGTRHQSTPDGSHRRVTSENHFRSLLLGGIGDMIGASRPTCMKSGMRLGLIIPDPTTAARPPTFYDFKKAQSISYRG